ncbi:Hypothetical protein R9X50_00252400 [Acrodontium crateriforme]|uniref:F-box domain-containing protein n=1 Tax=Acrodontium crateriforme TaxID=150365 RepID=A0AAQ3R3J3_9PEZI|nr:Hypothetical protein R9X50_00252400 [Acrodontium crateriforme]
MMTATMTLPTSLIDLLANDLILWQLAPYLPPRSIRTLSGTCKSLRELIFAKPDVWRYLDLSRARSAIIDSSPIDVGGVSWRTERMDESLTEDDFYAGPLRGIFNELRRRHVLSWVQTLVLDGLSVPTDLVREVVSEDRYCVRVLSIRQAKNLNQSKLQQILRYIARPTKLDGTPRLKALYFFGPKDGVSSITHKTRREGGINDSGVTSSEGAQIGAEWNERSSSALISTLADEETKWYASTGRALQRPQSDWPDTLQACKGVIAFDAVLCRGPRHDITKVDSKDFLQPTIAVVALGPHGCEICHSCPEGPAVFGETPESSLPLLGPPPLHASTVRAAQLPQHQGNSPFPRLILRCEDCLRGRWCEECNRWWCESCYQEPVSRTNVQNGAQPEINGWDTPQAGMSSTVKVTGVHRDCWTCGRTCNECHLASNRQCRGCRTQYCVWHDEGCSLDECAWCNHSRRRTRELY